MLDAEATPALFHQATAAARRIMERVEKLGVRAESVRRTRHTGAASFWPGYWRGGVEPHIPVIDRCPQTDGHFMRERFRYEPSEDVYYCPQDNPLRYRGLQRGNQAYS
jgi:hypothetical protein